MLLAGKWMQATLTCADKVCDNTEHKICQFSQWVVVQLKQLERCVFRGCRGHGSLSKIRQQQLRSFCLCFLLLLLQRERE